MFVSKIFTSLRNIEHVACKYDNVFQTLKSVLKFFALITLYLYTFYTVYKKRKNLYIS